MRDEDWRTQWEMTDAGPPNPTLLQQLLHPEIREGYSIPDWMLNPHHPKTAPFEQWPSRNAHISGETWSAGFAGLLLSLSKKPSPDADPPMVRGDEHHGYVSIWGNIREPRYFAVDCRDEAVPAAHGQMPARWVRLPRRGPGLDLLRRVVSLSGLRYGGNKDGQRGRGVEFFVAADLNG